MLAAAVCPSTLRCREVYPRLAAAKGVEDAVCVVRIQGIPRWTNPYVDDPTFAGPSGLPRLRLRPAA
jgi:hypothetical protein